MAATIDDSVYDDGLDAGLQNIGAAGNVDLHICNAQPTTYGNATTKDTYSLGYKVDVTITGPAAGDASGRKVTISAITDGTVDCTGTDDATYFALVDTNTSTLLVTQALNATKAVTDANTFTLTAFDVEITDPA